MTDPTQPRTPQTAAGRALYATLQQFGLAHAINGTAGRSILAIEDEARDAAVAPYVEALRKLVSFGTNVDDECVYCGHGPDDHDYHAADCPMQAAGALALAALPAVPEPPAADVHEYRGVARVESHPMGNRAEPPAAQADTGLDVERLAVVAAARRFLAAHDHVIASAVVTRDDTFAMKNRVDELRDVLRLYDENAARIASPRDSREGD